MQNKTFISEIFQSVQGEGPYIGVNQLFIRFSKCNLSCSYCDTNFKSNLKEYSVIELLDEINKYNQIHSVSLTGGEPLCDADFLYELLPEINHKIYLETNGTLYKELLKIVSYLDIISMDIKLASCSKNPDMFKEHERFINTAVDCNKEIFLKVVFDENMTENEIEQIIKLAQNYSLLIVLQPKMNGEKLLMTSDFIYNTYYKFAEKYYNVRLIPQVHKFLNIR